MVNRRLFFIMFVWVLSIAFGVFYNICVLDSGYSFYAPGYIATFSVLSLFGSICCVIGALSKGIFNKAEEFLSAPLFVMMALMVAAELCILKQYQLSSVLIHGVMVLTAYPLVFFVIKNALYKKYGVIPVTLAIVAMTALAYYISGMKIMIFTALILIISEFIAVKIYNPENKKGWIVHMISVCACMVVIFTLLLCSDDDILYRLYGLFYPRASREYSNLIDYIIGSGWFTYNLYNYFVEDISSVYGCTYAHILVSYGFVFTILLIIAQFQGIMNMVVLSAGMKDNNKKYICALSTAIIAAHFAISVASSFVIIPITEFGAPFVTIRGLEFCVIPVLVFIFTYIQDEDFKCMSEEYEEVMLNFDGVNDDVDD